MNRESRGIGLYISVAVVLVLAYFLLRSGFLHTETYTYQYMQTAVEDGKVAKVEVHQNAQVPTGYLNVHMTDGSVDRVNVSDVNEAVKYLDEQGINCYIHDVPQESIFLNNVLPMLLMVVVVMVMFMMMNRQAASGSGNKMMNFGKSRATMISPDAKKVTFKDVAGLQEEKEDLKEIVDFLKDPKKYLQVGAGSPKVSFWWVLREPVKPFSPRPWPVRQAFPSSAFPVLISWKCSSAWALPVSVTFSPRRKRTLPVSSSSTRSMPWPDAAEPVWEAATMRENRL